MTVPARAAPICALLGGLIGVACSSEPAHPPRWIHLAEGFEASMPDQLSSPEAGVTLIPDHDPELGDGFWVETTIPRAAWERDRIAGVWKADRPLDKGFAQFDAEHLRIVAEGREFVGVEPPGIGQEERIPANAFYRTPDKIHVRLAPDAEPPEELSYASRVGVGRAADGMARPAIGKYSGEGLALWPGSPARVELELPADARLRFTTVARPFVTPPDGGPATQVHLRVLLDGEEIYAVTQSVAAPARGHAVDLPPAGSARAELSFELEGPPVLAAIFNPLVGPREIGDYAERPWGATRKNIVLFLIDTFRADNLSLYGGEHGRAPELDRLLERSRTFRHAYASSSWTLPSQVSMLTGLHPRQHGADGEGLSIAHELDTVTELLARHGYRTGAVTDSGFVSRTYNFDQGFEWFEETNLSEWNLGETFRAATDFVARDDGRPVFLWVHTYRTHVPFRRGLEEDETPWLELVASLRTVFRPGQDRHEKLELRRDLVRQARELYLEGVAALDQRFGPWFADLEARRLFDNGAFIVTSDHGEAFDEHGEFTHGGDLWEEKTRVPLFLFGADLEPGVLDSNAMLVDLPRTLAELAGLSPPDTWLGASLLHALPERPVGAFIEFKEGGGRMVLYEGQKKIFCPTDLEALARGAVTRAFDLARDPDERDDVSEAEWVEGLVRRHRAWLETVIRPTVTPEAAQLSPEMLRDLEAQGYGGK